MSKVQLPGSVRFDSQIKIHTGIEKKDVSCLDSKQDSAATTAHSKILIPLLNNKTVLTTSLGTIWGNNDGCAEKYRCASALYLMSVMSQCYDIIIYRGISAPGYGKEVADGLNAVDKRYIYTNLCPRFNFMGKSDLIHRLKCTLALKTKM